MTNIQAEENSSDSQALLNKIVYEYMRDQKRKRVWVWVKRSVFLLLFLWIFYQLMVLRANDISTKAKPHVGLIDVKGEIFESQSASGDNFIKGLSEAYDNSSMKAVIIRIDSPGGSPVQADYMYNTLKYYRKKYPDIKIYAVCVDACASAAYYVAAAADDIYANPSSLVGSIGVLYNGFGFVDTLQKLGVTRRLQTAGVNKGFLDPFSAENPEQNKKLQTMLDLIHQQFISKVKEGRGNRLHVNDEIFSGLFWTGMQAKDLGLIDGFSSAGQLARDIIKIDNVVDYTHKDNVLTRVAKNIGTAMADQLPEAMGMKAGVRL